MRSANLSAPLKGFRPYNALIGLNQASGLAGGPDFYITVKCYNASECLDSRLFGCKSLLIVFKECFEARNVVSIGSNLC